MSKSSSRRNRNKKSRAELLAHLNRESQSSNKISRPQPQDRQKSFLSNVTPMLIRFAVGWIFVVGCMRGLKIYYDESTPITILVPDNITVGGTSTDNTKEYLGPNVSSFALDEAAEVQLNHKIKVTNEKRMIDSLAATLKSSSLDSIFQQERHVTVEAADPNSVVPSKQNMRNSYNKENSNQAQELKAKHIQINQQATNEAETEIKLSLNITPEMREKFHPVVKFPLQKTKTSTKAIYRLLDFTTTTGTTQLILPQDQEKFRNERKRKQKKNPLQFISSKLSSQRNGDREQQEARFTVGKYNENRQHLYSSAMFQNRDHQIDGYDGARTIHMGIDLGGPVGTKVYSFWNGKIHSLGYNDQLGDYGYVIVVEYDIPTGCEESEKNSIQAGEGMTTKVWGLYGHLDQKSIQGKKIGQRVKRGSIIGRMGDVHENGGWKMPHVHFQLSILEPDTHDMPGAVSEKDLTKALLNYPDPRLVVGDLY
eukprot:CAMPEP_0203666306 /NCGR_PEP_ID=MMETSP0090-20130426/3364_1 /ASSEMBLY_ACC=CAM_ASM_001088 /TAXON_ID=426623 /ORGANISM="Chaetoceros affinis, Strain CCMP159" /LENGTH=480 /DNA_ID=CAMNT_0050530147 /DNA_START=68 /DNA_END=1510 /DNA_ORIENTATION=+